MTDLYDKLGHVIPSRASAQMAGEREPLIAAAGKLCTIPDCLRDARADGLCIEHLEVREISRPYGAEYRDLRLAEECNCLVHKTTGAVVQPCADHAPDALVEPLR